MRCAVSIMAAAEKLSHRKIECDGTRQSGPDKRGEHLIERLKEGECSGYAEAGRGRICRP